MKTPGDARGPRAELRSEGFQVGPRTRAACDSGFFRGVIHEFAELAGETMKIRGTRCHLVPRIPRGRMSGSYDAAVIGAGVFGSWIAYHLQRAGLRVSLIEAYGAANNRASSGGESRIIRMGYGADEIYTRWSHRSLEVWLEFFERVGRPELFRRTGVLWMARENDTYTIATLRTLESAGV